MTPAISHDRLLLGLKGTMSEAELHVLRARLQGGETFRVALSIALQAGVKGRLAERNRAKIELKF